MPGRIERVDPEDARHDRDIRERRESRVAIAGVEGGVAVANPLVDGRESLGNPEIVVHRRGEAGRNNRIDAQIGQAKGREAESLAAYRLAVLHATEDVENAFSALLNHEQQAAVLARGEDALARARASSFAAYQRGAASLIDVLRADETLLQTADARAQARTDAARAAVAAYKALGGGWEPGSENNDVRDTAALHDGAPPKSS